MDAEGAREVFRRALAIAPDYPDALYWLGRLALMRAEGGPSLQVGPPAQLLDW